MKFKYLIIMLWALVCTHTNMAQDFKLSSYAVVSVLECEPGSDLYASFGHSAIRIQDPILSIDIIYNYGIFDFYDPDFYSNFVKGKLNYTLGRQNFSDFIFEYEIQERGVTEQVLDLQPSEKNALLNFLEKNYLPKNRDYPYEFLTNNCATKIRDLLDNPSLFPQIQAPNSVSIHKSYRDLISEKLLANDWPLLGINLVLGAPVDQIIDSKQAQFLPQYLTEEISKYTNHANPLILNKSEIIPAKTKTPLVVSLWKTPAFWSILILIVTVSFSLFAYFNGVSLRWYDRILFFSMGSVSLIISYLWGFSEHLSMVKNFNILWASPLGLFLFAHSFFLPNKIQRFLAVGYLMCLGATVFVHLIGFQKLDLLFFPIICALALRTLPLCLNKSLA